MPYKTGFELVEGFIFSRIKLSNIITSFVGVHPDLKVTQIYNESAPQGAPKPYVVFGFVGGTPARGNAGRKVFDKMRYIIKFIIEGDKIKDVHEPLAYLEAAFQQAQVESTDIIGCSIVSDVKTSEIISGVKRYHFGFEVEFFAYNNVLIG